MSIQKQCKNCGKDILTYPSRLKRGHDKFCSRKCATSLRYIKGETNGNWSGNKVTYGGLHKWIRKQWSSPKICEVCGTKKAKFYDWANLNHKYNSRERKFWKLMCRSCHMKYDYKKGFRFPNYRAVE